MGTPEERCQEKLLHHLRSRPAALLLGLVLASSLGIAWLFHLDFGDSALLYVGVPYLIATVLLVFPRSRRDRGLGGTYRWLIANSMLVFLATSLILREGFLCVLFFIPIYIIVVSLVFGFIVLFQNARSRVGRIRASVLPLILLASSLEGVVPDLSVPADYEVAASCIVSLAPTEVRRRLLAPMRIGVSRDPVLHLFPMPYRVEAGSLEVGAVHEAFYRYHRWFVGNTHEGVARVRVSRAGEHLIEIETLSDTSYIATYLAVERVRLEMRPRPDGRTELTLHIAFERRLSPAWYFGPLMTRTVEAMAQHLLREVFIDA